MHAWINNELEAWIKLIKMDVIKNMINLFSINVPNKIGINNAADPLGADVPGANDRENKVLNGSNSENRKNNKIKSVKIYIL